MRKLQKIGLIAGLALTTASCLNEPVATNTSGGVGYSIPAGTAYAEGEEIRFAHTEASDATLAAALTDMMRSPVLTVPSLASIPDSLLAKVYVFTNGLTGKGPQGFQADVFDRPASASNYTPLRKLHLVTWINPANARLLKSEAEVIAAESSGEIAIAAQSAVINMPFIVWSNGQR